MIGLRIVLLLLFLALFGSALAPYDPNEMDFANRFAPPSLAHPMGADDFGRDILSRIMVGARVSLQVGIIAVGIAAVAGTLLGLIAGYSTRLTDEVIMRAMDVLFAFPAILLAIAILAALGKGISQCHDRHRHRLHAYFARIRVGSVLAVPE